MYQDRPQYRWTSIEQIFLSEPHTPWRFMEAQIRYQPGLAKNQSFYKGSQPQHQSDRAKQSDQHLRCLFMAPTNPRFYKKRKLMAITVLTATLADLHIYWAENPTYNLSSHVALKTSVNVIILLTQCRNYLHSTFTFPYMVLNICLICCLWSLVLYASMSIMAFSSVPENVRKNYK